MSEKKAFRCAVYTRKSSEEGLDQDFNSLEAQREACEAYIRSQAHEGWKLIPDRFDDGGFSGGNMDRPALGRLMAMVRDAKVDVIVIYKIDRLTRSLTDFARLAETFDKHGVSFVSVTQQFNTTTSMGRLMLNVLLSFAQFEREITGERIRDKIAASKKKGMWMGGPIPSGYDLKDRQLIVNDKYADTIRRIFRLYLEEGNVPALLERMNRERIRTAARVSAKGRATGGRPFTRGHVYKLLSNPIYVGRVPHKGVSYPGQHQPIVDSGSWDAVQARLARNTQGERKRRRRPLPSTPLLAGLLFTSSGNRMYLAHATKARRRYHYYVERPADHGPSLAATEEPPSSVLMDPDGNARAQFTGTNRNALLRLPAAEVDGAVLASLHDLLTDRHRLMEFLGDTDASDLKTSLDAAASLAGSFGALAASPVDFIRRAIASPRRLVLEISPHDLRRTLGVGAVDATDIGMKPISIDLEFRRRSRQFKLATQSSRTAPANVDATLVTAVARAFDWFDRLASGKARSLHELAAADGFDAAYVGHILKLAFLPPATVEEFLSGRQLPELTADRMIWHEDIHPKWR